MPRQQDSKGELRAAFTMRMLDDAKVSLQPGAIGTFMRVSLAILFMYMIVVSHQVLGIAGPVFISVLFLVALFTPYFYQILKDYREGREVQAENRISEQESTQEI